MKVKPWIRLVLAAGTAASLVPTVAMAQSRGDVREERREARRADRDLRDERREAWRDGVVTPGERRDIRQDRRDVREERREFRDTRSDFRNDRRWDSNWRNDRRYDWRGYRTSNRNIYRQPRYYAPSGWRNGYRPFGAGYRLQPGFYGRSYWIADPYRYRLPPAYGSYRWVRYYDDVVLVDVTSGIVADVIGSFFYR